MAHQRPRRPVVKRAVTDRRRRRRRKLTWQQIRHFLEKKWVQFLLSMGVLTFWLRVSAEDFDRTEMKTISLQAVSVIVLHMLGKR